jgi:hypothetical protein
MFLDAGWHRMGAMADCVKARNQLFASFLPFSGPNIHAYVTENCDDFPI